MRRYQANPLHQSLKLKAKSETTGLDWDISLGQKKSYVAYLLCNKIYVMMKTMNLFLGQKNSESNAALWQKTNKQTKKKHLYDSPIGNHLHGAMLRKVSLCFPDTQSLCEASPVPLSILPPSNPSLFNAQNPQPSYLAFPYFLFNQPLGCYDIQKPPRKLVTQQKHTPLQTNGTNREGLRAGTELTPRQPHCRPLSEES